MTDRRFGYEPDHAWFAEKEQFKVRMGNKFEAKLAGGPYDSVYIPIALSGVLQRAQQWWVLGRPVEDVAAMLAKSSPFVRRSLDAGTVPVDPVGVWRWLVVPLVAGDVELARRLGPLVGAIVDPDDDYLRGLVALVADDRDAATTATAAFTARLDAPSTSPGWVETYQHLDTMLTAVATRDHPSLAAATAARDQAIIKRFGRNIESRRDTFGVLDPFGVAILRLAHVAGMTLNRDVSASLGIELIEYTATHPPAAGS
jgi:hypothetical protein